MARARRCAEAACARTAQVLGCLSGDFEWLVTCQHVCADHVWHHSTCSSLSPGAWRAAVGALALGFPGPVAGVTGGCGAKCTLACGRCDQYVYAACLCRIGCEDIAPAGDQRPTHLASRAWVVPQRNVPQCTGTKCTSECATSMNCRPSATRVGRVTRTMFKVIACWMYPLQEPSGLRASPSFAMPLFSREFSIGKVRAVGKQPSTAKRARTRQG